MQYKNYLLFSHSFLDRFGQDDASRAIEFVQQTAVDWYQMRNTSTIPDMVGSWVRPLLLMRDLDVISAEDDDPNSYYLANPENPACPLAACYIAPYGVSLDGWDEKKKIAKGQHWMAKAVRATKRLSLAKSSCAPVHWAVLTNGKEWRLLKTDHLRKYEAYLEIDLHSLMDSLEDPSAAFFFYRFFSREGLLPDGDGICLLDNLLLQSDKATEAVEEHLRMSVSDNLETLGDSDGIMAQLCMGIVRSTGQQSFTSQERNAIYRDATYLLYRLLFILYAEARDLLPTHLESYRTISLESILELVERKMQASGEDLLGQSEIWARIQRLFTAIRESDEVLGVSKYNGGLFEDDNKPYLMKETIADAFLAPALYGLAFIPVGDEHKRIDYRDLSVRHLGSLYEGMIEYKLFVAEEPLYARRDKNGKVSYLPVSTTKKSVNDELIHAGQVYFAQSPTERRATGTHYTSEDLVGRLVEQTVVRLLCERWYLFQVELQPWLEEAGHAVEPNRSKLFTHIDKMIFDFIRNQILSLRVCDPAMGSGHFLVHTAHRITNFVLEKLSETLRIDEGIDLLPDYWRRQVVENCLYGVDVNEMAVELAKLSLWLATMTTGKPLSFLDHHLIEGNSLVSTSLDIISKALATDAFSMSGKQTKNADRARQMLLSEAMGAESPIEKAKRYLRDIQTKVVETAADVKTQELDYEHALEALRPYRLIGDLIAARSFGWKIKDEQFAKLVSQIEQGITLSKEDQAKVDEGLQVLGDVHPVHWEISFLDVFVPTDILLRPGFDVIVGNPPYLGGSKISSELGAGFLKYLKNEYQPSFGKADLCAYFLRLGYALLQDKTERYIGFVVTNTASQGETRQTGLEVITSSGGQIIYADRFIPWHGDATVEVDLLVITTCQDRNEVLNRHVVLDSICVPYISSYLDDLPEGTPSRLGMNSNKGFQGDVPNGNGFFVDKDVASLLLERDSSNSECLIPFLTGSDLNRTLDQGPKRYIICFHDYPLAVAEKFPDLLTIVREKVKPFRDKVNRSRHRQYWWQFGDYRRGLRLATKPLGQVLVRSRVSEFHILAFAPNKYIFDSAIVVFAFGDWVNYGVLQSGIHEVWLRRQASTMRTDVRYTPADCFRTFPFPQSLGERDVHDLEQAAQRFYESRQSELSNRNIGLTNLYNLLHDPSKTDYGLNKLRQQFAEMDNAVLRCYGWNDIEPKSDFYPNNRKKIRFGLDPDSRREIFIRLLRLNQQIAAQEAAQGITADIEEGEDEEMSDEE